MPQRRSPEAELRSGLAQRHMPVIDGIRAIAVFLVIFYHAGFMFVPGGLGVLIFFVVSGFLITWLLLREYQRNGAIKLSRFYARRALRIFPAFYVYSALLLAILIGLHKRVDWPQTLASLFYVNNYYQAIHGDPGTGFSQTWSLGIEEQFYLLWPGLAVLLCARKRTLATAAMVIIAAVWIHRAVLQFIFGVWQGYFYEAFDTRLDHLMMGCLLAIGLFNAPELPIWRILCDGIWKPALTAMLLVGSVALENRFGAGYRDSIGFIADPVLVAILIPQLIAHRGRLATAWLDSAPVRYLGRISYSLYLYQQIVLDPAQKLLRHFPQPIPLLGAIAALILTASGSYFIIEKPFLRIKDRSFASLPQSSSNKAS